MWACETQILQRLAVLVVCHGLSVGQAIPQYILVQSSMPWHKAREFCQQHYIDLAVLSTEEHYFTLFNTTTSHKTSFWLGLQRQDESVGWKWVDGEELTYDKWFIRNYEVRCASLEAMLRGEKKLLGRFCEERHMFVCQGPDSPQSLRVDSVSSDRLALSWNVSAFMQMTPHSYKVEICTDTCDTLVSPYTNGSTYMTISINNLTSDTEFFIEVSAFVIRLDGDTDRGVILQSHLSALQVKTVKSYEGPRVILIILKLLKFVSLAPPLWILYNVLKKNEMRKTNLNLSADPELTTLEMEGDLISERHRGVG